MGDLTTQKIHPFLFKLRTSVTYLHKSPAVLERLKISKSEFEFGKVQSEDLDPIYPLSSILVRWVEHHLKR